MVRIASRKVLIIFLMMTMLFSISSFGFAAKDPASMISNQSAGEKLDVLVGFNGKPNPGLVRAFGGEIYAEYSLVDTVAAKMTEPQMEALRKNPFIRYIEPDAQVHALGQSVPWGINRVFGNEGNRLATWDTSQGAGIGVAVLDTGIDTSHEDLRVVDGRRFYIQGVFLRQDDQYTDGNGHGTHVAGTIAALDNDLGVVGVAPAVDLYAVKVLTDKGSGSISAIVAGIEWTVNHPDNISIINMSLGSSSYSQTFEDACNAAYNSGILVVASAGNSGNTEGTGDNVGYPARYDSVIAVSASDSADQRAYFSSTGPDVELIAPGLGIYSSVPGGYDTYSGTSMASPHVAGVAALVWAANPKLTNGELRGILQNSAEDLGLPSEHQGHGLVRADLAIGVNPPVYYPLSLLVNPSESGDVTGGGSYAAGQTVNISAAPRSGYEFLNWTKGIEIISTQANFAYTMPAEETVLIANFREITGPLTYELTMSADPADGGTAVDVTGVGSYAEGTSVSIRAAAASGYEFVSWEAEAGQFGDASNPETSFTMPAQDVTVTAIFQRISSVDTLYATVTTDKSVYKWNTWVYITVSIQDQNLQGVAGATVSANVINPSGGTVATFSGSTAADGKVVFSYRIPNKAAIGEYSIVAEGTLGALSSDVAEVQFSVSGK